jgi:hypothetical protein
MKTTLISLALSASTVVQAVKFVAGPQEWQETIGVNSTAQTWENSKLPKLATRASVANRQQLNPRFPRIAGSKSVKLRYGPYSVPAPMM